jgi:hypothetical protein
VRGILVSALAVLAFAASAQAAVAPPVACDQLLPGRATRLHEIKVAGDLVAFVSDPHGGYIAKQVHGGVQFSLRFRRGDRLLGWSRRHRPREVKAIDQTIDGVHTRMPFYRRGLAIGVHRFAYVITTSSGAKRTLSFAFRVGACDIASGWASFTRQRLAFSLSSGNNERGGNPALTRVEIAMRHISVRLPRSAIGRPIGTLRVPGFAPFVMRVPSHAQPGRATTVLSRGRLRVVFQPGTIIPFVVEGLPANTTYLQLELTGAGRRLLAPGRHPRVKAYLFAGPSQRVTTPLRRLGAR